MLWLALVACAPTPAPAPPPPPTPVVPEVPRAAPEPSWIDQRVAAAEARLAATEAGRLVKEAIDAAGGLRAWYSASPLGFRFDYRPLNGKTPRDTRQVVDLWRSRAVHTWMGDERVTFGWDGTVAWQKGPEGVELPINPRFWSLTPYYFVGMPFVLADEGVQLTVEGPAVFEQRPCTLVRVGFADGTGDAPDDAYVVYLDDDTRRVAALRYIVSYPGFFPEGGHSPWKVMAYDGARGFARLTLPDHFRTYQWTDEAGRGELVTEITLSDLSVKADFTVDDFAVPSGAVTRETL